MSKETVEIRNVTIIDGKKTPKYAGSILLQGDQILEVGPKVTPGSEVIEGNGLYIAPGFIDVHTHVDFGFYGEHFLVPLLSQGVTFALGMNCGLGIFPFDANIKALYDKYTNFLGKLDIQQFQSINDFHSWLNSIPKKINIGNLVPHGNLHVKIMNTSLAEPTATEREKMSQILSDCLESGFYGVSFGLIYPPGAYLKVGSPLFLDLGNVCKQHNAVFAVHVRDELGGVMEASEEIMQVGKKTGCSIEYSHIKIASPLAHGRSKQLIARIDEYIAQGVNVHMDAYPYDAAGNMLATVLLPPEVLMNIGSSELYDFLKTPAAYDKVYEFLGGKMLEMVDRMNPIIRGLVKLIPRRVIVNQVLKMMSKKMLLLSVLNEPELTGKSLYEAAQLRHMDLITSAFDIIIKNQCQITTAPRVMDWIDITRFLLHQRCMIGSDLLILPQLKAHPRAYGSFTGFLRRFPKEQPSIMGWEEAIYKMSGLPAEKFHIPNRGVIAPGMAADLVLFDPQQIADTALITDSEHYSIGINKVFVNGQLAYENGRVLPENYGKLVLKKRENI